ncbi:P1 family peptidase [Rhodovibrionaceae bacterium A322]
MNADPLNSHPVRPGPLNLITDVAGLKVGQAEDHTARSGVTVILPDEPVQAAVDVRGGGPGTRETDALDPSCLVDGIHALVFSGGSAYGLEAANGVMGWLATRGRGFQLGPATIPIVPSAILFDLLNGGDKPWTQAGFTGEVPYKALAQQACDNADVRFALGNAGAGLGATAALLKGGLGSASMTNGRWTVGALAAVNPAGSVVQPGSDAFWAWALERQGELGEQTPPTKPLGAEDFEFSLDLPPGANTTLAVVATDARLTKGQAQRVAIMAHDGFARAIRPVHTPFDGDSVFVLSTGKVELSDPAMEVARIGMLAADTVARAIARGVYEADSLGAFPGYRDKHGT